QNPQNDLADLVIMQQRQASLPPREIAAFSCDLLSYQAFIQAFCYLQEQSNSIHCWLSACVLVNVWPCVCVCVCVCVGVCLCLSVYVRVCVLLVPGECVFMWVFLCM